MNINEIQKEGISNIFSEAKNMFTDDKEKIKGVEGSNSVGAYFSENKEMKKESVTYERYLDEAENSFDGQKFTAADINEMIDTLDESITTEGYSQMETLGLAPKEDDLGTIVTVNERIQIQLAAYCDDYKGASLNVSSGEIKDVLGIAAAGNESNISSALSMAANIKDYCENGQISDSAKAYLLKNNLNPTIENTYKAVHSGTGAINNSHLSEAQWESMKGQVIGIYESAGIEPTVSNLSEGRWMIENNIPLNAETITLAGNIDSVNFNLSENQMLNYINDSMAAGISPEDTYFYEVGTITEVAKELVDTVNNVASDDLNFIVTNNNDLTFEALKEAKKEVAKMDETGLKAMSQTVKSDALSLKLVKAERIVFEARIMMTTGSVVQMMKMGISVDTLSLQDAVDKLKGIEGDLYKTFLGAAQVNASPENISMMQQTIMSAAYVDYELTYNTYEFVGKAHSNESRTLSSLTLMQMEATYEGVGTEVRKDLGDNISKAFENVDSLLESLNIELNDENRRAARILGYNSLEINEKNIDHIKYLWSQLSELTKNLTPGTVVQLIKDGVNPLETEISQLNEELYNINENLDFKGKNEKYSKFLWKLDKAGALTDDQRAAYIGMYRLINWAGKNDANILGSLYKQGSEINLKNLLMAARTKKVKGIDATLDDSFGITDEVTKLDDIERDILKVMNDTSIVEYTKNILHKAVDVATPEGFSEILKMENPGATTPEQLYEKLSNSDTSLADGYYKEQIEQINQAKTVSEEAIKSILNNNMSINVNNLLAAGMLYQNGRSAFGKIKKLAYTEKMEESIKSGTEEELQNAVEEVKEEVDKKLKTLSEEENSYDGFKDAILTGNLMSVVANMSRNRHYVVQSTINNETAIIKLSVGTGNNDTVGIRINTESYGEISARFKISGNTISGSIGVENEAICNALLEKTEQLIERFKTLGFEEVDVKISVTTVSVSMAEETTTNTGTDDDLRLFDVAKLTIGWL